MFKIRILAVTVFMALAACAQQPLQSAPDQPAAAGDDRPQTAQMAKPQVKPVPRRPPLPAHELTEDLLYRIMLAEVALQRGQPNIAVPAFLELAQETRDPRIAQRATEVAWNARFVSAALEAASIWLQADPEATQARQVIAALLVNQEQLEQAQPHLEKWIAASKGDVSQSFLQLSKLLSRHKDKAAVARLMQALAQPYADVPETRLAVAQAAWNAENHELSLSEARAALELRPDWELAVLFQAQVLQRRSSGEALKFLADFLESHPQAKDVRLNFARLLVNEKKFADARKQFEALLNAFPQNADVTMAVALLAIQSNDLDAADAQLKRALEINYKDPDAARYYLGQVNEDRKRFEEALQWYGTVRPGEQYINAQARYAGVLAKQGRLADARKHLQQVSPQNLQQRVQLTQAEAQLLRDAMAYQEAFNVLGSALAKLPDTPDLLYDHAMAAEKVNRVDVLEANLRKLIEIRPDHAHAYNALGYTLADRSERLPEARALIETALKLAPEDPFIMDSMGWVLYRLGLHKEGLEYLQRAFKLRPDPEIAAHFGELLWVGGQPEQAQKVWSDMLKEHPKNESLQNTIKRFMP
jgi:tetratricopeptide (TPR) repeat protein